VSSLSIIDGQVSEVHAIRVDNGTSVSLPCDNVVIAAGPWTGPLSKSLLPKPIPIASSAGHSIILITSIPPTAHCLMAIVHTENATYRAQVIPRSSGEIYISGINDTLDLPPNPEAAIPQPTEIAKLMEIADALLPGYSVKKEQLCFRPMTKDGLPFIGTYPEVRGVYVGAGHGHFGIILGPGTGKVLSEMILGETLGADISMLPLLK
jgi:glycine/D-amino acid oxidase-like deaminating enzyme